MKNLKFTLLLLSVLLGVNFSNGQNIHEGKKFFYYEKFISAKNVFQQLLTANPNNEEAAYWLGQTLLAPDENKDLLVAKEVYRKALEANSNSPLLIAGMGHIELHEGKIQEARNRFETAISLSKGKNIEVLGAVGYANGDFDSKSGDAAYAVEKLQQAVNIKGFKDAGVLTDLGDAYRKFGDGGSAQRSYEAALAIDPNYARAKFRIGRIYQSQGESQREIYLRYYDEAIALDPNYTPVYFYLHQYYYESDVVKSAGYLEKYLTAKGSDEINACFLRAQMIYAQAHFSEAIIKCNECIAAAGGNPYPNIYGIKAYSAYKLGDSVNAKVAFDMYFQKQNPAKIGSRDYYTYADVLLKFPGKEALAGTFVEKAVELDSTEAGKVALLKSVASTYEKRQQYAEAGEWYKKVLNIKKSPSKTDLYNAGYSYYRIGKFVPASELFNLYTQKFPEDIFGYYMMGKSYWGIDTLMAYGLANNSFAKAIEAGEAYPDKSKIIPQLMGSYKYMIAYAANIEKDKDLAISYCDKALLIDPTDQEVINNKEVISKIVIKPGPKTNSKADIVTVGIDGSINATGKDGSSTIITKEGKITTVKDGVTTIIENGKVTIIGKDGKVINTPPPPPAKPGTQKQGAPKKK